MPDIPFRIRPLPSDAAAALRAGAPDAYGHLPERAVSDGSDIPCRHCLDRVPAGAAYLVLAWRPFAGLHSYAETGPVFLCAEDCPAWCGAGLPPILTTSPAYAVRAYGDDERIRYGTGGIVPAAAVAGRLADLLAEPATAAVHIRSAANGCYQCMAVRPS